jgi:hypothetical protein
MIYCLTVLQIIQPILQISSFLIARILLQFELCTLSGIYLSLWDSNVLVGVLPVA